MIYCGVYTFKAFTRPFIMCLLLGRWIVVILRALAWTWVQIVVNFDFP